MTALPTDAAPRPPTLARREAPAVARRLLIAAHRSWRGPPLVVVLPSGRELRVAGDRAGREARLEIRDFRFFRRILSSGDLGFAEGYIAGDWDTPDLPGLLEAFSANFDRLADLMTGRPWARLAVLLAHLVRGNSRRGARRNVHAHYDLGNAFYGLWLDPGMTYSSALWTEPHLDLEAAQAAKYDALAEAAGIGPGDRVLEIGCGWGAFAHRLASRHGAQVLALTLSRAQHEAATRRVAEAGLSDRVEVRLQDYRDVAGTFDRVVSVEMFEAVGEAYWPVFFRKVAASLRPGGRAALQVITIDEALFQEYRRRPDFIQSYVFPGGMLPTASRFETEAAAAGLALDSTRRFGADYARTLRIWAEGFAARWPEARSLGFDERFRRLWTYYLGYCEAGFRTGRTDVAQFAFARS